MAGAIIKRWLVLLACAFALYFPLNAQAKLLIINTGDEMFEAAELPLQLQREMQDGYKMGYVCRHVGIFWADFYTWNCRFVAVNLQREQYAELPVDRVAEWRKQHPCKTAKRGLWNRYGVIPVSLLVLAIFYLCTKQFVRARKTTNLA